MKSNTPTYKIFSLSFLLFFSFQISSIGQTIRIITNQSSSTNIGVGQSYFHVGEMIYTEAEIGVGNFTTAASAINHIDFNIAALVSNTSINNYKIFLRDVPLFTTTFNNTSSYDTIGYTRVFSGTYNANAIGWIGVDLQTPFIRTPGNNLQLLIERTDSVLHTSIAFRSTNGNNTGSGVLSARRNNLATRPVRGTTIINSASAFRLQVQLRHINANDAAVSQIYTLGKLPIPFATPHTISASIINNGSAAQTNLTATLNVTGANTFIDTKIIPSIAPGASAIVNFSVYTPINIGTNTVTVSIPADDYSVDNTLSTTQLTTNNSYSYAEGSTPVGGIGVNGTTVDFVAKFTSSSPTSVNQVGIYFTQGGQPFQIAIWDKSGTGKPGAPLWTSSRLTTTPGLFTLPVSPAVNITDTFYVGVKQIDTFNIRFAYQNEIPVRTNTFFLTQPSGSNTWVDFAPGNPFKFMIEPRLTVANDVGVSTINNPLGGKLIDNCGITPQATIINFGSNDQTTPFNVTFKIKQAGAVVYTDTKSVSLNAGLSQNLFFAPFVGAISGNDSAFCNTSLPGDASTANDTVTNTFTTNNYSYGGGASANGGYLFANSTTCASPSSFQPMYNWITQTTNEVNWNNNGNDSVLATPLALPFTFSFFGNAYTQFWVSSNGWITFSNPSSITAAQQRTPVTIPLAGGIDNYIAGMLNDFDNTTSSFPDAHTYYGGDATQFVITFFHAHLVSSPGDYITFQIILKPDGNIFIQYNDAETSVPLPLTITNSCSVGIENATGSQGILYRLNANFGPVFGSPLALQFKPPTVVPVSLISFNATKLNKTNRLIWTTSQEINSSYFAIEKSSDGRIFSETGRVLAVGNSSNNSNYSFIDNTPFRGINYYRLRLVEMNNSSRFSEIKSVNNKGENEVTVFPNPVRDAMTVNFAADKAGKCEISISDLSGKIIYTTTRDIREGANNIKINTSSLPNGAFVLKIFSAEEVIIKKITK